MDAKELLRSWPDLSKANASRILHSLAWRLDVRYGGRPAVLTRRAPLGSEAIVLDIRIDDFAQTLAFEPAPVFPDLWRLKDRLDALPREVLLALVEKECGGVFQFLEDVLRGSVAVIGLSERPPEGIAFSLACEGDAFGFSIGIPPGTELRLGQLENLDVTHEVIRSLTREATACHAVVPLSDEEAAVLASGDCLVPPDGFSPVWALDPPADGSARIVSAEKGILTFAQLADDALPAVPEPRALQVVRKGRPVARCAFDKVGEAPAVRILQLLDD